MVKAFCKQKAFCFKKDKKVFLLTLIIRGFDNPHNL